MANATESLFDSVIPRLKPSAAPQWQDLSYDSLEEPNDHDTTHDDRVASIDEFEAALEEKDADGRRVRPQMSDENREAVNGAAREDGFDALAFYKSKRFQAKAPFPGKWGIFYLQPAISYLAISIAHQYPTWKEPRRLALDFLRAHERFHYQMDIQTLLLEAALGRHLYEPIRKALVGRHSHFVEEALANRQALDWSKKPSANIEEFARDFMELQPNAYARFDESRLQLAAEWAGVTVDFAKPGTAYRHDLAHLVEAQPKALLRPSLCPEYIIYPSNFSRWFSPNKSIPPVKTIDDADVKKLISSKYKSLAEAWESTKTRILEDRTRFGLNFKRWRGDHKKNTYSVRVDSSFRAHLRHEGGGNWVAYGLGPHTAMGHG